VTAVVEEIKYESIKNNDEQKCTFFPYTLAFCCAKEQKNSGHLLITHADSVS
jgi:hypothetical protein